MNDDGASGVHDGDSRMHAIVRHAWLVLAIVIAVVGLAVLFTRVAASPAVCASCHEMESAVATWRVSAHTRVGCPSCHETPRAWYELPATLSDRLQLLARDVALHISNSPADDETPHASMSAEIPDATCERCHAPGREISMRYGTLINHAEHAERNGSCVSCHLWTGHPDPVVQRSLQLMDQCFACHGRSADAKAPGTCDVCHPDSFDLRPISHGPDAWSTMHGLTAAEGTEPCLICHDQSACDTCHGLRMPHPDGWAERRTLHGVAAEQSPSVCSRCHTPIPDFCTDCHHEGYDSLRGSWIQQHGPLSSEQGAAACFDCHAPTACADCHTARRD
jgi:nitrate/TMAO reductase-like tetraheme cytochrome c subunit